MATQRYWFGLTNNDWTLLEVTNVTWDSYDYEAGSTPDKLKGWKIAKGETKKDFLEVTVGAHGAGFTLTIKVENDWTFTVATDPRDQADRKIRDRSPIPVGDSPLGKTPVVYATRPAWGDHGAVNYVVNKRAENPSFSVITYNVQMRPALDPNSRKGPAISSKLNSYDIVGIQENFENTEGLMSELQHPYKRHFSEKRSPALVNSGLAIFSMFQIRETKKEFYKDVAMGTGNDNLASKGILMTRIDINGNIVDVYNTHMHAGNTERENNARQGQADQLVNFIRTNSKLSHSIILMGDFNMSPKRNVSSKNELEPNVHYSDDEDMKRRTSVFESITDRLGLFDVIDTIKQEPKEIKDCTQKYQELTNKPTPEGKCSIMKDEIDRILYRPAFNQDLRPTSIRKDAFQFLDSQGEELSDGNPNIVVFQIPMKRKTAVTTFLSKLESDAHYKKLLEKPAPEWTSKERTQALFLIESVLPHTNMSAWTNAELLALLKLDYRQMERDVAFTKLVNRKVYNWEEVRNTSIAMIARVSGVPVNRLQALTNDALKMFFANDW